jgi:hypothetical protein
MLSTGFVPTRQEAPGHCNCIGPDSYRSVERALRNEHLRISLENYTARTVPALDIGAYADKVYQANRVAGL